MNSENLQSFIKAKFIKLAERNHIIQLQFITPKDSYQINNSTATNYLYGYEKLLTIKDYSKVYIFYDYDFDNTKVLHISKEYCITTVNSIVTSKTKARDIWNRLTQFDFVPKKLIKTKFKLSLPQLLKFNILNLIK